MKKLVVVVEDDEELREQIVQILQLAPDIQCAGAFANGREALSEVGAALLELPERTRQVFVLRRLEDMSFREIALRLGLSVSAVEKHMLRAGRTVFHHETEHGYGVTVPVHDFATHQTRGILDGGGQFNIGKGMVICEPVAHSLEIGIQFVHVMGIVRRGLTCSVFKMRMTSMATIEPAPLSVAPVPAAQESRCPPTITTSSFSLGSVPGISAMAGRRSADCEP